MVVYMLTCRITGKKYIGVTRQSLRVRMNQHRSVSRGSGMSSMHLLARAIREHGWQNFSVSVLAEPTSIAEMLAIERATIAHYGTLHPHGYNQRDGGGGWVDRPRTTGRPAWNRGITHSDESKALMSAQRQGAANARSKKISMGGVEYGCIKDAAVATGLSVKQVRRRLDKGLATYLTPKDSINTEKFKGRPKHTSEARERMSLARSGGNHYRARQILVADAIYPSIKDAEGVSGFTRMQLRAQLKDGRAQYLSQSRYVQ